MKLKVVCVPASSFSNLTLVSSALVWSTAALSEDESRVEAWHCNKDENKASGPFSPAVNCCEEPVTSAEWLTSGTASSVYISSSRLPSFWSRCRFHQCAITKASLNVATRFTFLQTGKQMSLSWSMDSYIDIFNLVTGQLPPNHEASISKMIKPITEKGQHQQHCREPDWSPAQAEPEANSPLNYVFCICKATLLPCSK